MLHLNRRIRPLSYRVFDRSLGFHHIMLEVFNGLHTVQAYSMENYERKRFHEATGQIKRTAMWAAFYKTLCRVPSLSSLAWACSVRDSASRPT